MCIRDRLIRDGEKVSKVQWGLEILNEIRDINHILNLGKGELIDAQIEKIKDYKKTNTYSCLLYTSRCV